MCQFLIATHKGGELLTDSSGPGGHLIIYEVELAVSVLKRSEVLFLLVQIVSHAHDLLVVCVLLLFLFLVNAVAS